MQSFNAIACVDQVQNICLSLKDIRTITLIESIPRCAKKVQKANQKIAKPYLTTACSLELQF